MGGGGTPCGLGLREAEGVVSWSWEQWEEGMLEEEEEVNRSAAVRQIKKH